MAQTERDCSQQLSELLAAEESFLRQRSRVKWLKEGDQNCRFFHNYVKGKPARSRISSLINVEGHLLFEETKIKEKTLGFYKALLGTKDANCTGSDVFDLQRLLSFRLSDDLAVSLLRLVTVVDIKAVIFGISSNKSPGPDGHTSEFFKVSWGTVGDFITKAILEFSATGKVLKAVNSTVITPVPKIPSARRVSDFWSISCCNFVYKCITNLLANRLKKCLPSLMSSNQSAFIEDRKIIDNI